MPPYYYRFHTAILGTNRQLNSEAANVFHRQNLFVSLTCGYPTCRYPKFAAKLKLASVFVVAKGHHASNFKHCSMEVHLGPHKHSDERSGEKFIIAGEDVPSFCNVLQREYFERNGIWGRENQTLINVSVQVNAEGIADIENENTGPENDCPSVKRLLEPLCRLRGMRIRVGGFVTPSYKERIEKCATRPPPTAVDLVSVVSKYREEGNEATRNGKLVTAADRYESALDMLNSGYTRLTDHPVTVKTSVLSEKRALAMMEFLEIIIGSVLASTYLKLGEHSKSYRCAQDMGLTKWHVFWYSEGTAYFEGTASIELRRICAHIMLCKALAGKALGQPVQALMDLDLGLRFDPDNEKLSKERKVMCGLILKQLDSDLDFKWPCALATRKKNQKQRQKSATAQHLARWKDAEALIKGNYVA